MEKWEHVTPNRHLGIASLNKGNDSDDDDEMRRRRIKKEEMSIMMMAMMMIKKEGMSTPINILQSSLGIWSPRDRTHTPSFQWSSSSSSSSVQSVLSPMFHNIVSLLLPVFYLANNPFLCPFCHQIIELVYFHQIPRHCVPGAPCVLPSATVLITQFGAAAGRQSSPCIEELQNLKMMAT